MKERDGTKIYSTVTVGQQNENRRLYMSATALQFLLVHILWDSSIARSLGDIH